MLKGLGSRNFDSEGVKTDTLKLVDQGILKHYLIDTYNGKKLNLKSNGRCGGTSNPVSYTHLTLPTNREV